MNDPVTQIAAALAVAAAEKFGSSAAKRLWAKVKEWTKSKKPEGTAILDYFADDPDHMVDAIRRLLQDTRAEDSQEILTLAREVLKNAGPSQTATGKYVVQAGGDVRTVIQADRLDIGTVVTPDAGIDTTYLGPEVPEGRDWRYRELASYMEGAIGGEPGICVAVDFGDAAEVFESEEQDHLRNITREFLGIRGGKERQDMGFAELFMSEAGSDGRKTLVQFYGEGTASVWVYRPDQQVRWDWVLVEPYRVLRCLCSKEIRRIYGSSEQGQLTLGVTWPASGIAPDGEHLGPIPATAPSEPPGSRSAARSSFLEFGVDPWPLVREFTVAALSRAGYKYHEKRIREMERGTVLEICFPHPHPLRAIEARYAL